MNAAEAAVKTAADEQNAMLAGFSAGMDQCLAEHGVTKEALAHAIGVPPEEAVVEILTWYAQKHKEAAAASPATPASAAPSAQPQAAAPAK